MAVSKRLRFEILRRDNHTCRYCGGTAPDVALTVDHVVPTALGGTDAPENLVAACRDCNSGKSATPADAAMVADVASDALRWAEAMHYAAEAQIIQRDRLSDLRDPFFAMFEGVESILPSDWERTFDQFIEAGLTAPVIADAARTAINARHVHYRDVWRYFCGICWRKIAELHEIAKALLAAEDAE